MKLPLAFLLIIINVSAQANNVCDEIANGAEKGKNWYKIDVPWNKFISVDIDNDGDMEQVGQFAGGTSQVPYLEIVNGKNKGFFGSDRCGGGSPSGMNIVSINNKNYIHVSIIKRIHKECGISGYLTEYDPKDTIPDELCGITSPYKPIKRD